MDNAFHLDLADLIQKSDATDIQGNIKGTFYIPPVKQFFYAHNFGWLQMSLIFGNTSALALCTLLRRILLPEEDEPAPDRYGYPASPCAQRQGLPIIPYP